MRQHPTSVGSGGVSAEQISFKWAFQGKEYHDLNKFEPLCSQYYFTEQNARARLIGEGHYCSFRIQEAVKSAVCYLGGSLMIARLGHFSLNISEGVMLN